jgi:hypothetical protein
LPLPECARGARAAAEWRSGCGGQGDACYPSSPPPPRGGRRVRYELRHTRTTSGGREVTDREAAPAVGRKRGSGLGWGDEGGPSVALP